MGTTEELDNRLEAFSIQRTLKRGNTERRWPGSIATRISPPATTRSMSAGRSTAAV